LAYGSAVVTNSVRRGMRRRPLMRQGIGAF
jgi:hypothetical protein